MISGTHTPEKREQLVKLAQQFDQAGEKSKAASFFRLAGEAAFATYDNAKALHFYQAALDRTPDAQISTRYGLMFSLEKVYALIGDNNGRSQNLISLAALADALESDQKRAEVAARLALFKLDAGENEDVISICRLAVRIAQMAQAFAAEADLNLVWGRAQLRLGNAVAARSNFQQGLTLAQQYNLLQQEAHSTRYLGVLYEEDSQYHKARALYKQALALYENIRDRRGNSDMLNNLGKVAFEQGEYTAAMRYWDHAKPNYLAIGDKSGLCRILINQSAISLDLGNYNNARAYSQEALILSREIKLRFGEALALINAALVDRYQGELDSAVALAEGALILAKDMGSKRLQGYAHSILGGVLVTQEKSTDAAEQFWQAFAIWHELEQESLIIEAEAGLMQVALLQNNVSQALSHVASIFPLIEAEDGFEGAESPFRIYWLTYQVLLAANDPRASEALQIAHHLLQKRANKIVERPVRQMFLEQVEIHRLIMNAFSDFQI